MYYHDIVFIELYWFFGTHRWVDKCRITSGIGLVNSNGAYRDPNTIISKQADDRTILVWGTAIR
jgi:hypothetical protein